MSIKKQKVSFIELTPSVLAEFRQASPLPGERPLKDRRLSQLLAIVKDNEFIGLDWHVGRCTDDGQTYRFDGQHTAHLLQDLLDNPRPEAPFPASAPVTLTEWQFDSLGEDASQIFNVFNNPLSVRSNTDAMAIYKAFYPDLADLSLEFLLKVTNGIAFFEKQRYQQQVATAQKAHVRGATNPVLAPLFRLDAREAGLRFDKKDARDFANWAWSLHDLRLFKRLNGRQGILARMFADWRDNVVTATQFWTLVFSEAAPEPDDETRTFAEQLKRFNSDRKKVSQDQYYKAAASAMKRFKKMQYAPPDVREAEPVIESSEPVTQETSQTSFEGESLPSNTAPPA